MRATATQPGEMPLSADTVRTWREQGAVLVADLFPDNLIHRVAQAASGRFPEPGSEAAEAVSGFGSNVNFPSSLDGFNELTLHPRLLSAASQLLGVPVAELRLTQSDLWPKFGRRGRSGGAYDLQDQRIHVDYPNHMLVHPTPWSRPAAVELIVYFDSFAEAGGATAFVPRQGDDDPAYRWPMVDTPGVGELDYINDRASAESYLESVRPEAAAWRRDLYAREVLAEFEPGDVLLYRHDTWHRGTPMKAGARRVVQNLTFRRADAEWIGTLHKGWCWSAYRRDRLIERLVAEASVDQRTVLGFPPPGSSYWCEQTVAAVESRFGMFGFDGAPYRR